MIKAVFQCSDSPAAGTVERRGCGLELQFILQERDAAAFIKGGAETDVPAIFFPFARAAVPRLNYAQTIYFAGCSDALVFL
jgi:hypothetical protein